MLETHIDAALLKWCVQLKAPWLHRNRARPLSPRVCNRSLPLCFRDFPSAVSAPYVSRCTTL